MSTSLCYPGNTTLFCFCTHCPLHRPAKLQRCQDSYLLWLLRHVLARRTSHLQWIRHRQSANPSVKPRRRFCTNTEGKQVGSDILASRLLLMGSLGKLVMPEPILLRDTLYLLQGISGKHIRFSSSNGGESMQQVVFSEAPVRDKRQHLPRPHWPSRRSAYRSQLRN